MALQVFLHLRGLGAPATSDALGGLLGVNPVVLRRLLDVIVRGGDDAWTAAALQIARA